VASNCQQESDKRALKNRSLISALFLIAITMMFLWWQAEKSNFIPCTTDCGETFVANAQIKNFELYGFKYGLLQDHANSTNMDAHPYLYTHNVSIPSLLFPLLDWAGVKSFWQKEILSLLVFGIGLFYVFLATLFHTRSSFIALTLLFLFCTDYLHVFSFGLNALRTWHWLVLFGLLFHAGRFFQKTTRHPWLDLIALTLLAFFSFGIGYDFSIICMSMLLILWMLISSSKPINFKNEIKELFLIGTIFAIPVILRQVHVASVIGLEFWYNDFIYSASIKVPFLKDLIELPSMVDLDKYYQEHHIMRAPASPSTPWNIIIQTFIDMVKNITTPSFGIITITLSGLTILFALILSVPTLIRYILRPIILFLSFATNAFKRSPDPIELLWRVLRVSSLFLLMYVPLEVLYIKFNNGLSERFYIALCSLSILITIILQQNLLPELLFTKKEPGKRHDILYFSFLSFFALVLSFIFIKPINMTLLTKLYLFFVFILFIGLSSYRFKGSVAAKQFIQHYFQQLPQISTAAGSVSLFLGPLMVIALLKSMNFTLSPFSLGTLSVSAIALLLLLSKQPISATSKETTFPGLPLGSQRLTLFFLFIPTLLVSIILATHRTADFSFYHYSFKYTLFLATFNLLLGVLFFSILEPRGLIITITRLSDFAKISFFKSIQTLQFLYTTFVNFRYYANLKGSLHMLSAITLGSLLGLAFFAPLSLHIYFKHQFPLLASPILLAKALFFCAMVVLLYKLCIRHLKLRWFMFALVTFFVIDHLMIQFHNIKYAKSISTAWIKGIESRKNSSFVVSWIPDSVSAYTDNWVTGLPPGAERKITERLQAGKPPFEVSDYFLFGQQDMAAKGRDYTKPDFWLYFPVEQINEFDSPWPVYHQDYLSNFIDSLEIFNSIPKTLSLWDGNGGYFTPGNYVEIWGLLSKDCPQIKKIDFISEGKIIGSANYNYIYGHFVGIYHVPNDHKGNLHVTVVATYGKNNKRAELGQLTINNVPWALRDFDSLNPMWCRKTQMTVDEIIASNPKLKIVERGPGYVLFDMREIYKGHY